MESQNQLILTHCVYYLIMDLKKSTNNAIYIKMFNILLISYFSNQLIQTFYKITFLIKFLFTLQIFFNSYNFFREKTNNNTREANQARRNRMDDPVQQFKNWYLSKPVVTRTYLTGCVLLALLTTLGILSPYSLYYTFQDGILQLGFWRLITTVLFHGSISFNLIFSLIFAYFSINNCQTQLFKKKTFADFLWLLILLHLGGLIAASVINIYFTADTFIFALMYIWCKRRPFETITLSLMFIPSGVTLKSGYFPWVFMGFNVLLGQSFIVYLVGLLLGHSYIFIKDIMLIKTHKDYLPTPNFFKNWVYREKENNNEGRFGGQGQRVQ